MKFMMPFYLILFLLINAALFYREKEGYEIPLLFMHYIGMITMIFALIVSKTKYDHLIFYVPIVMALGCYLGPGLGIVYDIFPNTTYSVEFYTLSIK